MEIDFSVPVAGLDGAPVIGDDNKPITLGDVVINALMAPAPNRPESAAEIRQKLRRSVLAEDIHRAKSTLDLTADEIADISTLAGVHLMPAVHLFVLQQIDPAAVEAERPETRRRRLEAV